MNLFSEASSQNLNTETAQLIAEKNGPFFLSPGEMPGQNEKSENVGNKSYASVCICSSSSRGHSVSSAG